MAIIDLFFNSSKFVASKLSSDLLIKTGEEFSTDFYIVDTLKYADATAVSSKLYSKSGRNLTELPSAPVWVQSAVTSTWTLTDTVIFANNPELILELTISAGGSPQTIQVELQGGS